MDIRILVIGIAIGLVGAYLLAKLFNWVDIVGHRKDAVTKAKSVVLWQATENIAPLIVDFPYHYKDCVFLGKGVDYIVFDGLYEWQLREIVMVEVKTGKSRLNRNEKAIQNAIKQWLVSYEVVRV